jgi:hypothetical protein
MLDERSTRHSLANRQSNVVENGDVENRQSRQKKLTIVKKMNDQLLNLYNSKWDNLCSAMQPILADKTLDFKPTCPLLLTIDNEEEFNNAEIRLMVYGQETNSWYNEFHNNHQPIIDNYESFFNGGECWSYGGQFWNGVSRFVNRLQTEYPDKKIKLVWNNIIKIGIYNHKGFPPDYIYEVEREHFSVIKEELQIIKPNIVLFFTGPNYDSIVHDNFGILDKQALSPFSERQISKVELAGVDFAFRTYHPNYLWRNDIDKFFDTIIEEIKL